MRIVAGAAKGRTLKAVPGTGTRPTSDKVKEAIFSMIGPYFSGGKALDLFAGTGALGIEALSRGCDLAVFVDLERKSAETVEANLRTAGMRDAAEIYRTDAKQAIRALAKRGLRFDIVFVDPPYRFTDMDDYINRMQQSQLFADGAKIVLEYDASVEYPEQIGDAVQIKKTLYGDIALSIYTYCASVLHEAAEEGAGEP